MRHYLQLLFLFLPHILLCQKLELIKDETELYKNIVLANKDPQYINVFFNKIRTHINSNPCENIPFEDCNTNPLNTQNPQSKFGSILLEGKLAPKGFFYWGKSYGKSMFFRRFLFTFDPTITLRMYKEQSSPVRPANFNPGFTLYYFLGKFNDYKQKNYTYLSLEVDHLSNGQQGLAYKMNSDKEYMFNYNAGNYSTNFLRANFSYNRYLDSENKLLLSNLISARFEVEIPRTPLSIDESQRGREGMVRFKTFTQLTGRNLSYGRRNESRLEKGLVIYKWTKNNKIYYTIGSEKLFSSSLPRFHNFQARLSYEYQLGSLPKYNFYGSNKYRGSIEAYVSYSQSHWNDIQFYGSFYYGRDYLNIRYSDVIRYAHIGVNIPIQRYKSPITNKLDYVEYSDSHVYYFSGENKVKVLSKDTVIPIGNELYKIQFSEIYEGLILDNELYPCEKLGDEIIRSEKLFKLIYKKL